MQTTKIRDPFATEMADFDRFPPVDNAEHAQKYIAKALAGQGGAVCDPDPTGGINATAALVFIELCRKTYGQRGEQLASDLLRHPKLETLLKNPAFLDFMHDYGMKSLYFVSWLTTVPSALALEAAYGMSLDVEGNYTAITRTDPFFWWVVRDPVFVYLRERALTTAQLVRNKDRVVFLGAGYLPELRHMGLAKDELPRQIIACDSDQNIRKDILDGSLGRQLSYYNLDLVQYLSDIHQDCAVVVMNGVLSYHIDWLGTILEHVLPALGPDGVFAFDLQAQHPSLIRNALVFGWQTNPPMTLKPDAQSAIDLVAKACQRHNARLETIIDSRNAVPTGVIFHVRR